MSALLPGFIRAATVYAEKLSAQLRAEELEEEMEEAKELIAKAARCDAPMTPIRMNILVDDVGGDAISAALAELLRGQGETGEHLPARAPRRKRCARHLPAQRRPQPRCPRHRAARPPYIHCSRHA